MNYFLFSPSLKNKLIFEMFCKLVSDFTSAWVGNNHVNVLRGYEVDSYKSVICLRQVTSKKPLRMPSLQENSSHLTSRLLLEVKCSSTSEQTNAKAILFIYFYLFLFNFFIFFY